MDDMKRAYAKPSFLLSSKLSEVTAAAVASGAPPAAG